MRISDIFLKHGVATCPECGSDNLEHVAGTHRCIGCGIMFGAEHKHMPGHHDQRSHAGAKTFEELAPHEQYEQLAGQISINNKFLHEQIAPALSKPLEGHQRQYYRALQVERAAQNAALKQQMDHIEGMGLHEHPEHGQFTHAGIAPSHFLSPSGELVLVQRPGVQGAREGHVVHHGNNIEFTGASADAETRAFAKKTYGIRL